MKIRYFEDLGRTQAYDIARYISDFSSEANSGVAAISVQEIMECDLAIIALVNNVFAGYIRAKEDISVAVEALPYRQVGTLVVAPEFQGNGLASKLVEEVTREVIGGWSIPFAFVNTKSEAAFLANGYEDVLPGELPAQASSMLGGKALIYPMYKFVGL